MSQPIRPVTPAGYMGHTEQPEEARKCRTSLPTRVAGPPSIGRCFAKRSPLSATNCTAFSCKVALPTIWSATHTDRLGAFDLGFDGPAGQVLVRQPLELR